MNFEMNSGMKHQHASCLQSHEYVLETSRLTLTALSTEFLATIHGESCRLLKGRGPISCADKCAEHCESSSFGMARAHFLCMAGCETSFESQRDCAVRSSSLNCGNSRGAAVRNCSENRRTTNSGIAGSDVSPHRQ